MSIETFLPQAFLYLAAAVVGVPVAKRLGLGSVLGYLLAGIVIGPWALGLVGGAEGEDVMHFAEFGVVLMLFVIGLELQPAMLWRLRKPILGLGGLQVGVTTLALGAGAMALGLAPGQAIAVGMILALSSTAIVLQTLAEKGQMASTGGRSAFSVLLFQDIAVIPMLALLPLLATGAGHGGQASGHAAGTTSWIVGLPPWIQTLAVLGGVGAILLGGRFLVRPVLRAVAAVRQRELFAAAALLLVVGVALLTERIGLSPALGTFVAGVVLADSEYRHELENTIDPFKGLLLGLFFIAVGASIDFGLIRAEPARIVGLTAAILVTKFVVLLGLARLFRLGLDSSLMVAFALPQMGEFAFVLFSFANQEGVLGPEITNPLVASVALSMGVTPLLLLFNDRVLRPRFGTTEEADREPDVIDHRAPVLIAGFGGFGSTVGRFLRANGVDTTVLDDDPDRVELLRRLGLRVFYGDATRHDLMETAGANDARLLVVAVGGPGTTLTIVRMAKRHFPHLRIAARAYDWPDAHDLLEEGVEHVVRQSLDAGLRLGVEVLREQGFRRYQSHRAARRFLHHDEESLIHLTRMRRDEDADYLSAARARIEDLERILVEDLRAPEPVDEAWDDTSLREEHGG
ncbi:MAG: monovalent cation:proton antiporter-2 (CPA2) family protein [Gemmatimonadota bacterium]